MLELEKILFSEVAKYIRIKPETKSALARLGIVNVRDLIFHKPNSYNSVSTNPTKADIKHGDKIVSHVEIKDIELSKHRKSPTKILVEGDAGPIVLVFFNKIPPFIFSKLKIGATLTVEGKVEWNDFYFQMRHPDFIFQSKDIHPTEPIYPLTYGLSNRQIINYQTKIFEALDPHINTLNNKHLELIFSNIKKLHFPENPNDISSIEKQYKILAGYELLANQINLAIIRENIKKNEGRSFEKAKNLQDHTLERLGFTLTDSQQNAVEEIEKDQLEETRMVRLLQGDVGSGKTLVAIMTILNVLQKDMQSVIMAPTDLLANQHYEFAIKALGEDMREQIELLTGKSKNRKILLERLLKGEIKLLIGTHAIFQEKVAFKDLAYIIIDEQHKFGVQQRLDLINKANMPDLLVMTATPIPRSLTLTMFGDMLSSKLTEKPKGRLPIQTNVMARMRIDEVQRAIERKLDANEKVYWVCPLIEKGDESDEENDNSHLMDVYARAKSLEELYPGSVGIVHGKMKATEKDEIMQNFKSGKFKILVATTVIEVGIDVPDATLIIIENAEKFGLSALHQLRGRVGRSSLQSHAILLYENTRCTKTARKRLSIMRESEDGFYIAEQDLLLRGGGEILGLRQSGEQRFIFADMERDLELLIESNKKAQETLNKGLITEDSLILKLFAGIPQKGEVLE